MEIGNRERREIADCMRTLADEGYGVCKESIAYAIGLEDGLEGFVDEDVFDALADLIEPTCHLLPSHDGGFGCDRCFTWFQGMKKMPAYCPVCGARVVDVCD